ncbi:hypothetical protein [Paenibacillus polysaccharolyticus]|nr:hypothetical protein [Paenibacillus polysaccharolyticus]
MMIMILSLVHIGAEKIRITMNYRGLAPVHLRKASIRIRIP